MSFILTAFGFVGRLFTAVLTWLSKNPAVMIFLVVVIAFAMLLVSKNREIALREGQLADMTASRDRVVVGLNVERANTASLKSGLDDANGALGLLQTKADDARVAYQKIIAGQAAGNQRLDGQLSVIRNAKPGTDKCASASALIRSAVQ